MANTNEGIGNNSYKGNGTSLCGACGEPLRDHRIARPCPEMGVDIFYVEIPPRRGPDNWDAKRQREYRARQRAKGEA
jgi:hypothetical protein